MTPAISVTPTIPPTSSGPPRFTQVFNQFAEDYNSQLYSNCHIPTEVPEETENDDWIDLISFECLENHPAFVRPPIDRDGLAEVDTIKHLPIEDLLASTQGVRCSALMLCPFFSFIP